MERAVSFSDSRSEELDEKKNNKVVQTNRNLSMNSIKINHEQPTVVPPPTPVQTPKCSYDFISITTQIDEFLSGIDDTTRNLPQLPIPATKHLIAFVEKELYRCFDSGPSSVAMDNDNDLLKAIRQIFTHIEILQVLPSDSSHANIISHTASVFHLAMVSIEEGFRSMLENNDDPVNVFHLSQNSIGDDLLCPVRFNRRHWA